MYRHYMNTSRREAAGTKLVYYCYNATATIMVVVEVVKVRSYRAGRAVQLVEI